MTSRDHQSNHSTDLASVPSEQSVAEALASDGAIQKPRRGRPPKRRLDANDSSSSSHPRDDVESSEKRKAGRKSVSFHFPNGETPSSSSSSSSSTSKPRSSTSTTTTTASASFLNKSKRTAEQQATAMRFFTELNRRKHLVTLAEMWIRRVSAASPTWQDAVCTILSKVCNNKIFSLACHRYVLHFFNECEDALQNHDDAERRNEHDQFWITLSDLATTTPDLARAWNDLIANFSMWTQYTVQNKMLSLSNFKHNALFDMETMSSTVVACLRRRIVEELGSLESLEGYEEIERRFASQSPFARRVLARRTLDDVFARTQMF